MEFAGLEQNASYFFEAFTIETDGTKTPRERIRSGYFRTRECNGNSKKYSRLIFLNESVILLNEQTILLGPNNLLSQAKLDKNLCKISKFVIKFTNGTEVAADLRFGNENSELISDMLEKHRSLFFEFEDAFGVTTLSLAGIFFVV